MTNKPQALDEQMIEAGAAALFSVSDFEGRYVELSDMSKQIYREKAYAVLSAAHSLFAAKVAELEEALDDLQQAEAEYRLMHDRHGDSSQAAGRAWDLMRRAGDKARAALAPHPEARQQEDKV